MLKSTDGVNYKIKLPETRTVDDQHDPVHAIWWSVGEVDREIVPAIMRGLSQNRPHSKIQGKSYMRSVRRGFGVCC